MKSPGLLLFLGAALMLTACNREPTQAGQSPQASKSDLPAGSYTFAAITDFQLQPAAEGQGEFYVDKARGALAINAAIVEYRTIPAAAQITFNGASGKYDVAIRMLSELDGESPYILSVNGQEIGRTQNVETDTDYSPHVHTWKAVALKTGDTITILSKPHTNGKIPEGDGTAWSRGRWTDLTLTPAK